MSTPIDRLNEDLDPFQDTAANTIPDKRERVEHDALDMEMF
jgi:hypothetical protein